MLLLWSVDNKEKAQDAVECPKGQTQVDNMVLLRMQGRAFKEKDEKV